MSLQEDPLPIQEHPPTPRSLKPVNPMSSTGKALIETWQSSQLPGAFLPRHSLRQIFSCRCCGVTMVFHGDRPANLSGPKGKKIQGNIHQRRTKVKNLFAYLQYIHIYIVCMQKFTAWPIGIMSSTKFGMIY